MRFREVRGQIPCLAPWLGCEFKTHDFRYPSHSALPDNLPVYPRGLNPGPQEDLNFQEQELATGAPRLCSQGWAREWVLELEEWGIGEWRSLWGEKEGILNKGCWSWAFEGYTVVQ